ncbi:hypothetical protein [Rhodococcus globerulus]|uniref:hypothetical protein n=1 Tax=Rhodococcus globerulus TaxID=33008 RepID=UPI001586D244|nr:hypothetical protein [Rhodococcus globerulus]
MMPVTRMVLCVLIGFFVALTSAFARRRTVPGAQDAIVGFAGSFVAAIALGVD